MKVADLFAKLGIRADKRSFSAADRLLGGVKKALVGIVAFRTVRWFGSLITDTAQAADNFAKLSRKVGISIEALQQFEFAAGISGTNLNVFRVGLQRFARVASDADRGLESALDPLKDANVTFKDGEGNLRALDEMLLDVADRFAQMPNGTKKTALAMELFGRSGAELIPLLNEGRGGIQKLRDEFVELGAQIDGQTAKSFEQFNDDQLRVRTALKGIRNQVVVAMLPTLKKLTKETLQWIKANRGLLKQRLDAVLRGIVAGLKLAAKGVALVADVFNFLQDRPRLVIALVSAFAALKLASVGAAVASAAAWGTALLPIVLLAAIVAGAVLVWDAFHDAAVDALVGVIEFVEKIVKAVGEAITIVAGFAADPTGEQFEKVGAPTAGSIVGRRLQQQFEQTFEAQVAERRTEVAPPAGPTVNAGDVNVTVQGAANPEATAAAVGEEVDRRNRNFWDARVREFAAATEQ